MAAEKSEALPMPKVALVWNVCESMMLIVLLSAFTVRMLLVWKLEATE